MFTTSCGLLSISKLTNSNLGGKDSFQPRKHVKPRPLGKKQICHLSGLQGVLFYMCVSIYVQFFSLNKTYLLLFAEIFFLPSTI